MTRPRLTLDTAKKLAFQELLEQAHGLIADFEAPEIETNVEKETRITRTFDQLPDIYGWLLQLESWFGHWADFYYNQDRSGLQYKEMKGRRDAMESAASAAKMRYEGTSRELTRMLRHEEEASMPRGRG